VRLALRRARLRRARRNSAAPKAAKAKAAAKKEDVPRGATRREIEMGNRASQELEKNPRVKLLDPKSSPTAKALLDKLNDMARELAANSARPEISYEIKVIDEPELNAFTLPNGKIYLYRGLLEFAASDDEIAGVLSHEIGHNALLHAVRGEAKAKKLSWAGLAAMAAMMTWKSGRGCRRVLEVLADGHHERLHRKPSRKKPTPPPSSR
jgi:predicted Zn-dependent protease